MPSKVATQPTPAGKADSRKVVFTGGILLHEVDLLKFISVDVPAAALPCDGDGEYVVVQFEEELDELETEYANVPESAANTTLDGALEDFVIPL